MNVLMGMIVVLLTVIVLWMIGITALYVSLYKGLISVKGLTEAAAKAESETLKEFKTALSEINKCLEAIEDCSLDCFESVKTVTEGAVKNKEFAMKTIRTARAVYKTVLAMQKRMENDKAFFQWVETEEDPENPRS